MFSKYGVLFTSCYTLSLLQNKNVSRLYYAINRYAWSQSDEKLGFSSPIETASFDLLYEAFSKPRSLNGWLCCLDLRR